jgi:type I restriction enzyme, S subunit
MSESFQLLPLEGLLDSYIGGLWGEEPGRSEVDVKVMRITELGANGTSELSTSAIRSLTHKQVASRKLHEGDLVLEKSGGGPKTPVGRVALISALTQDVICSNFMLLMRPNHSLVLSKYLHHFLTYLHVTGQTIPLQSSSTNIRNISTPDYMQVQVPVPSLDEQKQIVETLDEHLSRLDKALAEITDLNHKVKGLIGSLLDSEFYSTKIEGGEQLSDFVRFESGYSFKSSDWAKAGMPVIRIGNIQVDTFDSKNLTYVSKEVASATSKWSVRKGDVLLTLSGATLGASAVYPFDQEARLNQRLVKVTPKSDQTLDPNYLLLFLQAPGTRRLIFSESKGAAQPNISPNKIGTFPFKPPSLAKQIDFMERLEMLKSHAFAANTRLSDANSLTVAFRWSLLHSAFAGQFIGSR